MEHLKIAIADDNQKILDLLDRVIGMEKDMNLVGKAKNGEEMCQIIKDKQPDDDLLDHAICLTASMRLFRACRETVSK